ncbi:MAG: hypothetical protein ACUVSV_12605 [Armatimonadota bacterium]
MRNRFRVLNVYPLGAGQIHIIETDPMAPLGEEREDPQFGIIPMQVDLSKIRGMDPWQMPYNEGSRTSPPGR